METQRQRMKRRMTDRKPTEIKNCERLPKTSHPFTKILVQQPLNYRNRATRRAMGMHKGLPDLFSGIRVIKSPNHQQRVNRDTHKIIPFGAQVVSTAKAA